MDIILRVESSADHSGISDILNKSYLSEEKALLIEKLRKGNSFIPALALIAEHDTQIVGHLLIIKISIMEGENLLFNSSFLASLAVLPKFRNNGIATKLLRKGAEQAINLGYKTLLCSGPPDLLFKLGFTFAEEYGIIPPYEVPEEELMALELVKGGFAPVSGILCYPEEFYSA